MYLIYHKSFDEGVAAAVRRAAIQSAKLAMRKQVALQAGSAPSPQQSSSQRNRNTVLPDGRAPAGNAAQEQITGDQRRRKDCRTGPG